MIWWYGAFMVLVFAVVAVVVRRVDASWRCLYNPWVPLGALTLVYSLTPLSSAVIRHEQRSTLEWFLLVQLVGLLGLGIGTLVAYGLWYDRAPFVSCVRMKANEPLLRVATLTALLVWLAAFHVYEGGIDRVIVEGYLYGESTSSGDVIAYALATYPLIGLIIVGYFARGATWDVVLAASLFAILNVLGGHRNLMLMELGGLLAAHSLRTKRPGYRILLLGSVFGFAVLMIAGIYRQFGVRGLPLAFQLIEREGVRLFDPSSQELGTSFNVFRIFRESNAAGFESWLPGESYVRAFLAVMPRRVWPDRPDAIANYFSDLHAIPGEGLGFSYNLEAYVSFGTGGVMLATAVLGFIVATIFINHCSRRVTLFGISFYGTLLFLCFNLNRIDFQTVLKIGALLIGAQYAVLRAVSSQRRSWFRVYRAIRTATSQVAKL